MLQKKISLCLITASFIIVGCSSSKVTLSEGVYVSADGSMRPHRFVNANYDENIISSGSSLIYVEKKYIRQFEGELSKYDDILEKAKSINEQLSAIEYNMNKLPEIAISLISLLPNTATSIEQTSKEFEAIRSNPEMIIEALKRKILAANMKIVVVINETDGTLDIKLTGSDIKPELATDFAEKFKKIFEPATKIKNSSEKILTDSKDLINNLSNLIKSAPNDFKGMNALKAPKAITALTDASKQIAEVPKKVSNILSKTPAIIISLGKLAN